MAIKGERHIFKGMQRDLSISKYNPEFYFDALNIRITARDNNTLLSVTNERGTKEISILDSSGQALELKGVTLGYNVLNNYLTLFNKADKDYIYRLESKENNFEGVILFEGDLNFNINNPIETLGVYETEDIQKVYWVDGINQPRVINITASSLVTKLWDNGTYFDFSRELKLEETITVESLSIGGSFSSGTIQYAFSYYNKYGQESSIFYTTPINYITFSDRGASPEEKTSNSFLIKVDNLDTNFEYIRIYSIQRTSIDATPIAKRVIDLPIKSNSISYIDSGYEGDTIDPTELLYIGGESIIANTITSKDNTLFLGNITLNKNLIPQDIIDNIKLLNIQYNRKESIKVSDSLGYYSYKNTLLYNNITSLKYKEWYKYGLQFQYKNGKWSEPLFIKADQVSLSPILGDTIEGIEASTILSQDIIDSVKELGYKKVRGIICFPSINNRSIVAQGILCPTIYNIGDRYSNSPFVQASWFSRPFPNNSDTIDNNKNINEGALLEYKHGFPIPSNINRNAEIQLICNPPSSPYISKTGDELRKWVYDNQENYFIDQSILTLHSPDIEFDTEVQSLLNSADLKLRIVGKVDMTANSSYIDIQATAPVDITKPGFYKENIGVENISKVAYKSLVSGGFWIDSRQNKEGVKDFIWTSYMVYPWHRSGSLNDCGNVENRSAVLQNKKMSNLKFSNNTTIFNNSWEALKDNDSIYTGITKVNIAGLSESLVKIPSPKNSDLDDLIYYSDIDKVLTCTRLGEEYSMDNKQLNRINGYPIIKLGAFGTNNEDVAENFSGYHNLFIDTPQVVRDYSGLKDNYIYGSDPVNIKYKSTPHAVFSLNYTEEGKQRIIPIPSEAGKRGLGNTHPFWDENYKVAPDTEGSGYFIKSEDPPQAEAQYENKLWHNSLTSTIYRCIKDIGTAVPTYSWGKVGGLTGYYSDVVTGYVYLVTVVNEKATIEEVDFPYVSSIYDDTSFDDYGGFWVAELYKEYTDFDESDNDIWIPSGEPVSLDNSEVKVVYSQGDTYLQRYDCLKTYPYTQEDTNSIIDIVSFMCETRVNIDGRYDRNRGQINNIYMTPTNFNLINNVYTQKNNFFNYRPIDYSSFNLSYFPNTITWSKEKQAASDIDTWTNITMASVLDLDGDKGKVISLNTFNNEIYCFQERGLSNILFNSRVQIPSSDGVPIEITNGLKVNGKRYISNTIGCNNKWSIAESPSGLYFIDNETNSLYLFNGQLGSLSDKLGFRQWIGENNSHENWNPVDYKNFRTFYDKNNDDVYFINKSHCLCYSELLQQFTSFMSYENIPAMFNISSDLYSIKDNKIWKNFEGDYNMFYGEFKPYYITLLSNSEEPYDKIFNTIEFRADSWNNDELINNKTFDTLEVWNEYQRGESNLENIIGYPSPLKKKFRVWRANIPRDKSNNRDRIRNTWAYIKLSMNKENTWRTELHDVNVYYFI